MTETRVTRTATIATLDPNIRAALSAIAAQHELPGDLADTTACCVTTIESKPGLLGKIFGGGGPKTWAVVLTQRALLWAMADGKDIAPNGGHIRDIELRPNADVPVELGDGLNLWGHYFRGGGGERGSVYVKLGPGDDAAAFRNAVTAAITKR